MAINKVVYEGDTLIDLTNDTVTEADVMQGVTFHSADGVARVGTASGGGSSNWDDIQGKPTTFPPSIHSHDKIINGDDYISILDGKPYFRGYVGSYIALERSIPEVSEITDERIREICVPRQPDGYSIEFPASISATSNFEVGYTNGTTEAHPVNWYAGKTINSVDYFQMSSLEASFDTTYTFLTSWSNDRSTATSQTVSRIMTEKYVFLTSNIRITNIIKD